jgi:hypothetical protein
MICHYCNEEGDTRPYGPGGSPVCHPCITSDPERNKAAQEAFNAQVFAALAIAGDEGGLVALDASTGDFIIMTAEQLEEFGGLPLGEM